MQFLPYAGDGIHWPDSIFESKHRFVSGIGENAIQPTKAAELHVRDVRARAPLQRACKAISLEGISGTCAPAVTACKVQAPNKPKDHRRTLSKWVCPTRPVLPTGSPRLLIASYLKRYGAPTHLPFNGRRMSKTFARHLVPQPIAICTRSISASQIGNALTACMTASDWRLPPTKLRRKSVRSLRSMTMCRQERRNLHHRKKWGMRCSAVRRDATSVTAMADPEKSRCSRTSPPAIWAYLGIQLLQFYFEGKSDERGYSPNTAGAAYIDSALDFFCAS